MQVIPPKDQMGLLDRVENIAGLTLGELAYQHKVKVPANLKREKGWVGQLIEVALGATAGSKPLQDFPSLGIELKTLPLSYNNTPLETTYVCYAPLTGVSGVRWELSNVRNKLRKVLWVPIQGERDIPLAERIIGHGFMWQPSQEQEAKLKRDWEELMEMISLGQVEKINATYGEVMQLRPKAADGKALTQAVGENGQIIMTRPRGFYLRKNFTQDILNHTFY
ncbi:DNA mismatch repair endonuclease MutH [Glaciecola sp. 1036]|uniref:DNA mismatch repair endonuclease MutH n=1 Tax=Alteromonadaceae TaxID=72275 RepID=UPI003D03E3E1